MTAPRAVIADDELLLRQGLERLLTDGGIDVVATAGDASDLIRKTRAHRPDVVITDVRMPPDLTDDGLRAAIAIRRSMPGTGVLVLSQHLAERYALQLLGDDARASATCSRTASPTSTTSSPRCARWRRAGRRWTPRWSRG